MLPTPQKKSILKKLHFTFVSYTFLLWIILSQCDEEFLENVVALYRISVQKFVQIRGK
jgi:hypothetical protein